MNHLSDTSVAAGLFGVGLDTYWPQFKGLRERLLGYQRDLARRISSHSVELVDAGLVDSHRRGSPCGNDPEDWFTPET